jgi:hypothetical protein
MQTGGRRSSAALISAVVVLLTVNTLRGQAQVAATAQLSDAEYDVLSAYIAGTFTGLKGESRVGKGITRIIIINATEAANPLDDKGHPMRWKRITKLLRKEAPALDPTTLEAFRKTSTEQVALRRSFQLGIDYELVDAGQIDRFSRMAAGGLTTTRHFLARREC